MTHLLHTLYSSMWSNMWAPSIPTMAAFAWHHVALRRHISRTVAAQTEQQRVLTSTVDLRVDGGALDRDLVRFQRQQPPGGAA